MNTQLVEIQPRELKFVFEVKKQSVCTVHLTNLSDQYVAFKVKTTSPKKYCVRPNVGIIKPKSTCDFIVTMQAQKSAPSDMQCKDKFLIQSTGVPYGTAEDDITPAMFSKESQNYIEETKLRVILATEPNSPEKAPNSPEKSLQSDVVLKQEASSYETVSVSPIGSFSPVNVVSKQEQPYEVIEKEKLHNGFENPPPAAVVVNKEVQAIKIVENTEEPPRSLDVIDDMKSAPMKFEVFPLPKVEESKKTEDAEVMRLKQAQEFEELRSKINVIDAKLVEAQHTIEKLNKEKNIALHEKETLKQQLAMLRTRSGSACGVARKVHVGFPPLYVFMIALISLMLGISFRS